jgi:hypothetical protein
MMPHWPAFAFAVAQFAGRRTSFAIADSSRCAGLIVRSLKAASKRQGFDPENAVALSFDVGLQVMKKPGARVSSTSP